MLPYGHSACAAGWDFPTNPKRTKGDSHIGGSRRSTRKDAGGARCRRPEDARSLVMQRKQYHSLLMLLMHPCSPPSFKNGITNLSQLTCDEEVALLQQYPYVIGKNNDVIKDESLRNAVVKACVIARSAGLIKCTFFFFF